MGKGQRPKKKVVLFLVEGRSDRMALQLAISELYDRSEEGCLDRTEVFFPVMREEKNGELKEGGDITSKFGVKPEKIQGLIYELFLSDFFDEQKIMPKDVQEIIQIVDMDGAFVPDECIVQTETFEENARPRYREDRIETAHVDHMIERNERKRANLEFLSSLHEIKVRQKTVPYSVYYFSSNLDHFLHNDANMEQHAKVQSAEAFADGYIGNVEGFVKQIAEDPGAANGKSYGESWDFIKERGLHSLERHTNLDLLLLRLLDGCKDGKTGELNR